MEYFKEHEEEIIYLYELGMSTGDVGDKVGWSGHRIWYHLNKWGITRPPFRTSVKRRDAIKRLHEAGFNNEEISRLTGCSVFAACKWREDENHIGWTVCSRLKSSQSKIEQGQRSKFFDETLNDKKLDLHQKKCIKAIVGIEKKTGYKLGRNW